MEEMTSALSCTAEIAGSINDRCGEDTSAIEAMDLGETQKRRNRNRKGERVALETSTGSRKQEGSEG